jgi:adenosine deaminase
MEGIEVKLSVKDINDLVKDRVLEAVKQQLSSSEADIKKSIEQYFKKPIFDNKINEFERSLDWSVEAAFREGVDIAMKELKFKELIAEKAKEILSDGNFIQELALQKVKASLGLKQS